jgi:predicted small secreted protein
MTRFIVLAAALAVAACQPAGLPDVFESGKTAEQQAADKAACRNTARAIGASFRDVYADCMRSRGYGVAQ